MKLFRNAKYTKAGKTEVINLKSDGEGTILQFIKSDTDAEGKFGSVKVLDAYKNVVATFDFDVRDTDKHGPSEGIPNFKLGKLDAIINVIVSLYQNSFTEDVLRYK